MVRRQTHSLRQGVPMNRSKDEDYCTYQNPQHDSNPLNPAIDREDSSPARELMNAMVDASLSYNVKGT